MITEELQVKTPTKKEYIKVVQCMLDNGSVWANGEKEVLEDNWEEYKEKTIVYLGFCKDNTITYSCGDLLDGFNTYTPQEFLDGYDIKGEIEEEGYWEKNKEDLA